MQTVSKIQYIPMYSAVHILAFASAWHKHLIRLHICKFHCVKLYCDICGMCGIKDRKMEGSEVMEACTVHLSKLLGILKSYSLGPLSTTKYRVVLI